MIEFFERTARLAPSKDFLTFVDTARRKEIYSYRQVRMLSAFLAFHLQEHGVKPDDAVVVDLPNSPAFVCLALAAAYGRFTLVCLNQRLTAPEKKARIQELSLLGVKVAARIDEQRASQLLAFAEKALTTGDYQLGHRSIMGDKQDVHDDAIHFAERAAHLFDPEARAIIMFTSGTTGRPKAVPLTWRMLESAAFAANDALAGGRSAQWQAALPFYHIGGFQVLVRSVCGGTPLLVYQKFDPQQMLRDARQTRITHTSVVDKMLQDLLDTDSDGILSRYQCILLGGAAPNKRTLERCRQRGLGLFASYGMTETSSLMAASRVDESFDGGLRLLPGYVARIVDPDPLGFGALAVKGPGVFGGYMNARAPRTVDGFFLTGDVAALKNGKIHVRERTEDMFVSGGENIYPAEVVRALQGLPGVADAHVFGIRDEKWGRRPVALVELRPGATPQAPWEMRTKLAANLSRVAMPQFIALVDELPRQGIGKIDRSECQQLWKRRLQPKEVRLRSVRVPFKRPFKTAKGVLKYRDLLLVEVEDHQGRIGLGECNAFSTPWYLPETLGHDERIIREVLAPMVTSEVMMHPRDFSAWCSTVPAAAGAPMACAAVEEALWDLYGKICGEPLWASMREEHRRLGALKGDLPGQAQLRPNPQGVGPKLPRVGSSLTDYPSAYVAAGAVLGIASVEETLLAVRALVGEGFARVKMKVAPRTNAVQTVRAVCEAFPQLMVTLDANQSFSVADGAELQALCRLPVAWIEEPIAFTDRQKDNPAEMFRQLSALQEQIACPICLDESITCAADAYLALRFPQLRIFALKPGKFGGIQPSLEFVIAAQRTGALVWLSGMYDTGISRRVLASFEVIPGLGTPGDIGSVTHFFPADITLPPYEFPGARVTLNPPDHPSGLGCALNEELLR
ncbi:MAG: AMP-binding protein [Eggerthellaceae bacterium]|nr:AMP-binding protein [Eggerthellaceae bacterium]